MTPATIPATETPYPRPAYAWYVVVVLLLGLGSINSQNNMLFFAPFTGSLSIRSHPNVYTIRASYEDEAQKIMEAKRDVGASRTVVVYYDDAVGRSNYEAVASVFARAGADKPCAAAPA